MRGRLGEAVRTCGIPREDLRVVSKLPGRHHAYAEAIDTIQESVYGARLDYYDLCLIRWPNPRIGSMPKPGKPWSMRKRPGWSGR
jgi:diketogulonate reductase-like aldo/keto reductase